MRTEIADSEGSIRLDADMFFNIEGNLTLDVFKKHDEQTIDSMEFPLRGLVAEFIRYARDGDSGFIEPHVTDDCYRLIDALKSCLGMIEDALYEDIFPDDDKPIEQTCSEILRTT